MVSFLGSFESPVEVKGFNSETGYRHRVEDNLEINMAKVLLNKYKEARRGKRI